MPTYKLSYEAVHDVTIEADDDAEALRLAAEHLFTSQGTDARVVDEIIDDQPVGFGYYVSRNDANPRPDLTDTHVLVDYSFVNIVERHEEDVIDLKPRIVGAIWFKKDDVPDSHCVIDYVSEQVILNDATPRGELFPIEIDRHS